MRLSNGGQLACCFRLLLLLEVFLSLQLGLVVEPVGGWVPVGSLRTVVDVVEPAC